MLLKCSKSQKWRLLDSDTKRSTTDRFNITDVFSLKILHHLQLSMCLDKPPQHKRAIINQKRESVVLPFQVLFVRLLSRHLCLNFIKPQQRVCLIQTWWHVERDHGGFLLICIKDTPKSQAIPSIFSFVHPQNQARWSFGDFRVQISTSNDFHDTTAHQQVAVVLARFKS